MQSKREIRFWYRPNVDFFAVRITEQNPCGCCPESVIFETKSEGRNKVVGSYVFKPEEQTLEQYMASAAWEELK
jgi:hypothetical protein